MQLHADETTETSARPTRRLPYQPFDRLSMPFHWRLPLLTLVSAVAGFGLGAVHGGNEAGMRYRAENTHRLPNTQTGWYLYHKSKNYNAMLGGIYEGFRMTGRLGVWTGVFVGAEEAVDWGRAAVVRRWRNVRGTAAEESIVAGNRDFASTTLAGMGTSGAFSLWNNFPVPTAARLVKTGAKVGLAFGVMQDAVSLMRGRRLGYVEFTKRSILGLGSGDEATVRTEAADG